LANHESRCPKCAATERIPDVELPTYGVVSIMAKVDRHPNAVFMKGATTSAIRAVVCGQCGFMEFYAVEPGELLSAYREGVSSGEGQ